MRKRGLQVEVVDERVPACRHHGTCSGCPLMTATPEGQASLKIAMLRERFGLEVDRLVQLPNELGYRWSAKRVVGGRPGAVTLGSYQRGTHVLASMHDCLVDHPDIAAVAREIERAASKLGIEPYDEARRRGDLRYVWLKTDGRGRVLVTLVTASEKTRAAELAAAIAGASGVAWSVQAQTGNAMRGSDAVLLSGEGTLTLELAGQRVVVGPLGFLQPNPAVAELAYLDLVGNSRGALAFDLYAGAGITTALLRERYTRVLACESDPEAAEHLGIAPMRVEEFLAGSSETPDLIVANPPRAGLGEEVCAHLCRFTGCELRIMSCHPAALKRDLDRLESAFDIVAVRAYDTLPQTVHVELVAWLRSKAQPS